MRLLELCLSPDLGGLELYMVRAAKALEARFDVISVINPRGKLEPYFEGTSCRYVLVEKRGTLMMLGAARRLARIFDAEGIDVVHLHWTNDIPVCVLAKKLSKRKPKLVQTRNMTMTKFKDDPYHRLLYRNLDMMLPVTRQVAEQLVTFIPESARPRIEVLYMGSDVPEMLGRDDKEALKAQLGMPGGFNVGMVGRIEEGKGQYLLIDAVAKLRAQGIEASAFFVGHEMRQGYIDELKARARAQQVGDAVHFLGFMKNPHHFYQVCDTVVLATDCETFGLVLIEAMQVGTAVIGTNRCGPLEIIDPGETGLLFENADSGALAEAIRTLYASPERKAAIAAAGRAKAERLFANATQFEKLAQLLAGLAD